MLAISIETKGNSERPDLTGFSILPRLEHLHVGGSNLSSLAQAPSLRWVNLAGNPVRDWSLADGWAQVHTQRK